MSGLPLVSWRNPKGRFHLSCRATDENRFCVGAESVEVTVGQAIRRHGKQEIWESVGVYAGEEANGTLAVRVVVFNPDWDEPLQIACIRSRPQDEGSQTALGCNLDHVEM